MTEFPGRGRRGFLARTGSLLAALGLTDVLDERSVATAIGGEQERAGEYRLQRGLTYLNTASLGPTPMDVLDRTLRAWHEVESNPVRMSYGEGPVHVATDQVRADAAAFLGCQRDSVLITRSTTEAMNTIALGMRLTAGDRVLTTDQEHHGGSDCWRYLVRRRGIALDLVKIATSDHDPKAIVDRFAAALTASTRAISVSHILTSTGLRMPVTDLAALARSRGILCIVDGAQAIGQIDVNVRAIGCHAYAACGHKWLMAPKGTGLLYVSPEAEDAIAPIQWQDTRRYVAGSTGIGSLPLVIGLGAAIANARARGMPAIERRVLELRDYTVKQIRSLSGLEVVSAPAGPMTSGLVAARVTAPIDAATLHTALRDKHSIMVKLVEKQWFHGIRISPHIFNSEADIDRAIRALRTELA